MTSAEMLVVGAGQSGALRGDRRAVGKPVSTSWIVRAQPRAGGSLLEMAEGAKRCGLNSSTRCRAPNLRWRTETKVDAMVTPIVGGDSSPESGHQTSRQETLV